MRLNARPGGQLLLFISSNPSRRGVTAAIGAARESARSVPAGCR
jgi:hypothetical protein